MLQNNESYGEIIFEKFLKRESPNLVLSRIPREKNKKSADFFLKKSQQIIGVCEIKDLEDPDHHSMHLTPEILSTWSIRHAKLAVLAEISEENLNSEQKIDLEELKQQNELDYAVDDEHSRRLQAKYRSQIERKYEQGISQLRDYVYPKILIFISFNMADLFDLKAYLMEPQREWSNQEIPDLCLWFNIDESVRQQKTINITKLGLIIGPSQTQGKFLVDQYFYFFKSLELRLPIKLIL